MPWSELGWWTEISRGVASIPDYVSLTKFSIWPESWAWKGSYSQDMMRMWGRFGWLSSWDHPFWLSVGAFLGQPESYCEALTYFLTLSQLKGCRLGFSLPWIVLTISMFITLIPAMGEHKDFQAPLTHHLVSNISQLGLRDPPRQYLLSIIPPGIWERAAFAQEES